MRAREPDQSGQIVRGGVRVHYEAFGRGEQTLLLLPAWSIVHSRIWKAQIPYLASRYRVVAFDGRGNGRSDRPSGPEAYRAREYVADALAVMDALDVRSAVAVGLSLGGHLAALLASWHPERVEGAVLIAPAAPIGPAHPNRGKDAFLERRNSAEGWAKYNQHHWRADYADFARFFFDELFCEPHSTKQREDGVAWALETSAETLIATVLGRFESQEEEADAYSGFPRPALVIHGDQDRIVPYAKGRAVAEAIGAQFVTVEGAGHAPNMRDPARINLLIRDFVESLRARAPAPAKIARGLARPRRALYLSSPIGLGHARRDLAIARELRKLRPDLQIDWLAQDPVTRLLAHSGESIHPASARLANESRHIESEAGEHDLNAFQALRRMDEILVANFMQFQEAVEEGCYDLVIADEAWDVDHFWHEHPELKRSALAWLTDFVGYLPMPESGEPEARLTADYNAEMIEHVERHPRVRDLSIFVGNPDDVVPLTFGPGLPGIRDWTARRFAFSGYVMGEHPARFGPRDALRAQFGYAPDEKVCLVSVGGSAVGAPLLRRAIEAFPAAERRLPGLRMIVVTGPRIDPASLPRRRGVEAVGWLPDLDRRLAACDLAMVQGGLTTCMELAAAKTPFLYFPLRNHFEQNFHVRRRLERYGAGRCMDYGASSPELLASAIAEAAAAPACFRDVEADGAARAARLISTLI